MEVSPNTASNDYRVELGVFQGPLDLLLYLIRKEEVDIYDIPIAKITRQYLNYIEVMKILNLELAGEFILMAASLIRIKTRLLLPRDENDPEEMDPREELVLALIEYKKFKEAGEILREKALIEERNYVPPSPVSGSDFKTEWQVGTSLFDMLSAFRDVLKTRRDEVVHEVNVEEVSIEDRIQYIQGVLSDKEFASFVELFADIPKRIVVVVTFIAILEMARLGWISISQSMPYAEVRIYRGEMFTGRPLQRVNVDHQKSMEQVVE